MKKKILTFILSICFIIPCMFVFSACSNTQPADIEFKVENGYIQYYDGETWNNLIAIADLEGEDGIGIDGREVEFKTTQYYIQWRYKTSNNSDYWRNLIALSELQGDEGTDGKEVEFRKTTTHIQWRYVDANQSEEQGWTNLIALSELQGNEGTDGKEVEFRKTTNHIQWRYVDANQSEEQGWTNLITIEELNGEDATYSTYSITYDYQDVERKEIFNNVKDSQDIKSTEWLTEMPQPKDEFKDFFDGWYIKETDKKIENYDFVGGDVSLEARWLKNTFESKNCLEFNYVSSDDAYKCKIDLSQYEVVVPAIYNGNNGFKKVINIESNYGSVDYNRLNNIVLPESLKSISDYTFSNCTYLTNIEIPYNVFSIGHNAFEGSGLLEITIPNNTQRILSSAFKNCKALTNITIPTKLEVIGIGAFYGCDNIEYIIVESQTIANDLNSIDIGMGGLECNVYVRKSLIVANSDRFEMQQNSDLFGYNLWTKKITE